MSGKHQVVPTSPLQQNIQTLWSKKKQPPPALPVTNEEIPPQKDEQFDVYRGAQVNVLGAQTPGLRLCMLVIGLIIVILLAISLMFIVSNQHQSHSFKLGQISDKPTLISQNNIFALGASGLQKQQGIIVTYPFRLPEQIQIWLTIPPDNSPIPGITLELYKLQNFNVCCFSSDESNWVCSNGESFDVKLKVMEANQIQLLTYVHSIHFSGCMCMLEMGLLS